MSPNRVRFYEFGPFALDTVKRLLLSEGGPVALAPKAFDTLLTLVENSGQVLAKEELISKVWPDSFVEEINLTVHVSALRKALGDSPNEHKYIVTIPRRGYSFVASVTEVCDGDDCPPERGEGENRSRVQSRVTEPANAAEGLTGTEAPARPRARASRHAPAALALWAVLCAALAAGIYFITPGRSNRDAGAMMPKSIAVLPFKDLNPDGEEYLELGMADALITRLSKVKQVSVRPTSAVLNYTGQVYDPVAAGRKLGVDAIIQGTIQRDKERTRVTVQMISTASGSPVWAERFDENDKSIFAIQDSISEQVSRALTLTIAAQNNGQQVKRDTESTEAYRAYLRGLYFWNKRSDEGLGKARDYFQQAIDKDPNYARAHAMLADTFDLLAYAEPDGAEAGEYFEKAKSAALRAIEIDETIAEAHTALAMVRGRHDSDRAAAEREHKRAIELNPNYATAHQRYGWFLGQEGQLEAASQEMRLAVELDPLSVVNASAWGHLLYSLKQFDAAIEQCLKALELDPEFDTARAILAMCYEQKRMYDEALEEAHRSAEAGRPSSVDLEIAGHIYAVSGRRAEALNAIERLKEYAKADAAALYSIAIIHEGLGSTDEAFVWLMKAAKTGVAPDVPLTRDPRCEKIVDDTRFAEFRRVLLAAKYRFQLREADGRLVLPYQELTPRGSSATGS